MWLNYSVSTGALTSAIVPTVTEPSHASDCFYFFVAFYTNFFLTAKYLNALDVQKETDNKCDKPTGSIYVPKMSDFSQGGNRKTLRGFNSPIRVLEYPLGAKF